MMLMTPWPGIAEYSESADWRTQILTMKNKTKNVFVYHKRSGVGSDSGCATGALLSAVSFLCDSRFPWDVQKNVFKQDVGWSSDRHTKHTRPTGRPGTKGCRWIIKYGTWQWNCWRRVCTTRPSLNFAFEPEIIKASERTGYPPLLLSVCYISSHHFCSPFRLIPSELHRHFENKFMHYAVIRSARPHSRIIRNECEKLMLIFCIICCLFLFSFEIKI